MGELSFDNILGEQEIETLFTEPEETAQEEQIETEEEETEKQSNSEDDNDNSTTEVVNPESLFEEEQSESVGSEKNKKEKEDATSDEESDGTSPNENFYSSIANALAVDGIFPNLDETEVKKAVDAESFSNLIEAEINARLDEKQQRIAKALENGVDASEIKKYEATLKYISDITDAHLNAETPEGEELRKNLIYQDYINKGMSPSKAQKLTERTIDAGTDVDDAKEALVSNKEYFTEKYNDLLKEAQAKADKEKADRAEQAKKLETSILKDKQLFGDIELSNDVRKKAFDTISKPVYRDPESGQYLTALQKYEMEHHSDFLKYAGLFYALTDGFTDFDSFAKGKVKKEIKKGLRELEQTLNNTRRSNDGSLKLVAGVKDDPESFIGRGMSLDL